MATQQGAERPITKMMRLRYAGTCRDCGAGIDAGASAVYDRSTKTVQCLGCAERADAHAGRAPAEVSAPLAQEDAPCVAEPEIVAGSAGASARREYERRSAKREERVRAAHPRIGGFLLAVSEEPQSTTAWAVGARGEALLGEGLDRLAARGVRVLHDRRIPRSRANIDHIAVGPAGVHVIDAKRYVGKRPTRRVEGGLFGNRKATLYVGSRERGSLVEGVLKQVAIVRTVLDDAGHSDVPVRGVLCFIDGNWPVFGGDFDIDGVDVLWPKKLGERLVPKESVLTPDRADAILRHLANVLVSA